MHYGKMKENLLSIGVLTITSNGEHNDFCRITLLMITICSKLLVLTTETGRVIW